MGDSSGPSGFRRFFTWCFWIFFVLLVGGTIIGLVARSIFIHQTDRAWEQALAEVEAVDPEWRWEQLEAKRLTIPDDQNSGLVIVRLRDGGLLKENSRLFQSKVDAEPMEFGDVAARNDLPIEPLPMPEEYFERSFSELLGELSPEVRPSPALASALGRELAKHQGAIAEALRLADMPTGRHPIEVKPDFISTLLPTIQFSRSVVQLLALEAARRAEAGDAAGALRCARACLNAGRSTGEELFLITVLVRIALDAVATQSLERALAQGEFREAELAAMQADLEAEVVVPRLLQGLRGERAGMMKLCDAIMRGDVNIATLEGGRASSLEKSFGEVAGDLLVRQARPEMMRLYTQMIDTVQKPPTEWENKFKALEGPFKHGAVVTRLLMPAVIKVSQAEIRCQATLRAAAVALAAERFRLARQRWPQTLQELATAGFVKEVSIDPYTGEPLRLAQRASGVVIYSVGPDRVDDGGVPLRPAARLTGDIIFRVYDPKCRRATPEPLPMPRENPEDAGAFGLPLN